MTDQIHLAVYRDCKECDATGFYTIGGAEPKVACAFCKGQKMVATYIPIDELNVTGYPSMAEVRDSIIDWVWNHDRAVDHLAAELEASGLVAEIPGPGREGYADDRDHLTVSGTFQSDKYKWCPAGFVPLKITDPAARDLLAEYARRREPIDKEFPRDLLEALDNVRPKFNPDYKPFILVQAKPELPEGAWPEHPAKATAQESLEFGVEQIVANSCPTASMAKMDHAGNPIDDRDERLQGIYAVALDVLARMRGIGQEPQPAKAGPPNPCPTCGRIAWKWNSKVEKWACEPCSALYERKETPDLGNAARQLVDVLKSMSVFQSVKSGKTKLQEAMVDVLECLDGRGCALPRPYRVEAILANMDRQAKAHSLDIPDTVCLLGALLQENESLACQVIADHIGHDAYYKLCDKVALELAGEGDIVHRAGPQMCAACNGTGEVQGDDGPEICSGCNGSGAVA